MTTRTTESVNTEAILGRLLAEQAGRLGRLEDQLDKLIAREREGELGSARLIPLSRDSSFDLARTGQGA